MGFTPGWGSSAGCKVQSTKKEKKKINFREFSGNPVGSIPGQGTKILPAACQKRKVEENCFNNICKD